LREREIRLADAGDLPAIVEIYNHAVEKEQCADLEPVTVESRRAWFEAHPAGRRPLFVCVDESVVVGWASLSDHRPGRAALRHTAEITNYVHRDWQRRGVGAALVEHCLASAAGLEIRTLFAILLDDNAASMRLLEKFGFEHWGHLPRVAEFGEREVGQFYYGRRV